MRINIAYHSVNDELLETEVEKFAAREAVIPYIIMNNATLKALMDVRKEDVTNCYDGTYEFQDCKVLINEDLHYGDVDIR